MTLEIGFVNDSNFASVNGGLRLVSGKTLGRSMSRQLRRDGKIYAFLHSHSDVQFPERPHGDSGLEFPVPDGWQLLHEPRSVSLYNLL